MSKSELSPASLEGGRRRRRRSAGRKSRGRKGKRGGGFLANLGSALVPFGLVAVQKRTQRRMGSKKHRYTRRRRGSRRR